MTPLYSCQAQVDAVLNTHTMTRKDQIVQDIYTVINGRLNISEHANNLDHSQRLAYELGFIVGILADLAERDSYVHDELYTRLRRRGWQLVIFPV